MLGLLGSVAGLATMKRRIYSEGKALLNCFLADFLGLSFRAWASCFHQFNFLRLLKGVGS